MTRMTINCSACGSDQFIYPENPQPEDTATCSGCGKTWVWGELKAGATEAGKKALEDILGNVARKMFKK